VAGLHERLDFIDSLFEDLIEAVVGRDLLLVFLFLESEELFDALLLTAPGFVGGGEVD